MSSAQKAGAPDGASTPLWATMVMALFTVAPFVGLVLVYSDLTGQRPIHDQATIGLFLLWLFIVMAFAAVLDRLNRIEDAA